MASAGASRATRCTVLRVPSSYDQGDGERLAFQGPEVAQQFAVEYGHVLSPSSTRPGA